MKVELFFFYFYVYSLIGWIVESLYRTIQSRKLTNSGLLSGPFIPIYGFGAIAFISLDSVVGQHVALPIKFLTFMILASGVEYFGSLLMEEIFHLKLWDYSQERFNLHGRICLQYSLYWLLLGISLIVWLHPFVVKWSQKFDLLYLAGLNRGLGVYFFFDFLNSIKVVSKLEQATNGIKISFDSLPIPEFENLFKNRSRILTAFPNLKLHLQNGVYHSLRIKMSEIFNKNSDGKFELPNFSNKQNKEVTPEEGNVFEIEYYKIVKDILKNKKFQELKNFKHHSSSIYEHAKGVSFLSYKLAKSMKLDANSTARGALLHDMFFYQWRTHQSYVEGKKQWHAFHHPKEALKNAEKEFQLSDMERDIIEKHMWPLPFKFPKYKESFLVSFVDKYLAIGELLNTFRIF